MTTPPQPPPPPPGGAAPQPAGYSSNEDKTWALISHFGGAAGMFILTGAGGWIAPLVALLARGNLSPTVRAHAVTSLNFFITWSIVGVIGWITVCILIGALILPAAVIIGIIFGVVAGVKATTGELYNYPMAIRFVK